MKNIKIFIEMLEQLKFLMNKKQKKRFLYALIALLIVAVFETLGISIIIPYILAILQPDVLMQYDIVILITEILHIQNYINLVILMSVFIIVFYVMKGIIILQANYVNIKFQNELQHELSVSMLRSYMKRPYTYFLNINSSTIMRGIDTDIAGVGSIIACFSTIIVESLTFILIGGFLIILNPLLSILLIIMMSIFSLIIILSFKKKVSRMGSVARSASAERYKHILQAAHGIKDIVVMQRMNSFANKYESASDLAFKTNIGFTFVNRIPAKLIEVVFIASFVLIALASIGNEADIIGMIPQLGAFVFAAVKLLPSASNITSSINTLVYYHQMLRSASENFRDAREYKTQLEAYNEISGQLNEADINELIFKEKLEIESIYWKYDESKDYILKNLSLSIYKGEAVAFIGESGSGKTTLADIILGLLRPQSGNVRVDGLDVFSIPKVWAKTIGYVPQVVFLIDDTIRNNVLFGETHDNDQDVWKALEQAQLKDFIEQLPNGLDTFVGDRGIKISGGQRQRIAIARALYHNPDILVLDEATSALDNETETAIMESIDALKGHKTLIIIAHRLTTIKNCNKVYEIKDGLASSLP